MTATESARENARKSNGQFGIQQYLDDELAYLGALDSEDPVRRSEELNQLSSAIRNSVWEGADVDGVRFSEGTAAFIIAASDRRDLVAAAQARTNIDESDGIVSDGQNLKALTAHLYDVAVEDVERRVLRDQMRQAEDIDFHPGLPEEPSDDFIEF